jgi:hypothetical protein
MGTPAWLYYLFGLLMLAVAVHGLALLIVSVPTRQFVGRDVDIAHIFMGVSMAGMFVGRWAFGPRAIWELIFAVLLIWFVTRTLQSVQRWGVHLPHEAVHATMSLTMLFMYWYPVGASGSGASMSMSMSASPTTAKLDPGLGFLLAVLFFVSAVFTLASPVKGASHHGTHVPVYAISNVAASSGSAPGLGVVGKPPVGPVETLITAPWLEDASHVLMCIGMGFMLILML